MSKYDWIINLIKILVYPLTLIKNCHSSCCECDCERVSRRPTPSPVSSTETFEEVNINDILEENIEIYSNDTDKNIIKRETIII